ncbi:polysaccharide deacetylase family protein [Bacteroidota bacterium]
MKGLLTKNKIDYVLFHLGRHCRISEEISNRFVFLPNLEEKIFNGKIIFPLSNSPLVIDEIITKESIPVLFPLGNHATFYRIEKGNLIFHDDLLKSCFYLLSGYQELETKTLDRLNRFPFKESLQHKLDFVEKPVVNYLFEIIIKGLEEFSGLHKLPFTRLSVFDRFCFFLSHDVDRLDTYTFYELGFRFKQAIGLSASETAWGRTIRTTFKYLLNYLFFFARKNPQWDFPFHMGIEREYGINSSYYFLPQGLLHQDAYYSFSEKRVLELVRKLADSGSEIGLHGSVRTYNSETYLQQDYKHFTSHFSSNPQGIRQHRLLFDNSVTPRIQNNMGLKYDASLGFAESEGFRNSYCFPFKLFNHENDAMLDIWEIPLLVMDATLYHYKRYSAAEAEQAVQGLIHEVEKFGGIFSLLWHNGYFNEELYPGIREMYINTIKAISEMKSESLTGKAIIERMEKGN